jgi:hypothetical protein
MFNPMAVHRQEVPSSYVCFYRGRKMGLDFSRPLAIRLISGSYRLVYLIV